HLDSGFLTLKARSRMAGSIWVPRRDRGAWNGGRVQPPGSDPGWPLIGFGVIDRSSERRVRLLGQPTQSGDEGRSFLTRGPRLGSFSPARTRPLQRPGGCPANWTAYACFLLRCYSTPLLTVPPPILRKASLTEPFS